MIDLQPFCGTDECRFYLMKPFSRDGFTWATDGHIMVRVALREDVPDTSKAFKQGTPLEGIDSATFLRPMFELPPAPTQIGPCKACEGRGCDHDCPDCECICEKCHGSGDMDAEKAISTNIGAEVFCLAYVRQMLSLPEVEIETPRTKSSMKPFFFRFAEGVGVLMPRRGENKEHVDIKLSSPLSSPQ